MISKFRFRIVKASFHRLRLKMISLSKWNATIRKSFDWGKLSKNSYSTFTTLWLVVSPKEKHKQSMITFSDAASETYSKTYTDIYTCTSTLEFKAPKFWELLNLEIVRTSTKKRPTNYYKIVVAATFLFASTDSASHTESREPASKTLVFYRHTQTVLGNLNYHTKIK